MKINRYVLLLLIALLYLNELPAQDDWEGPVDRVRNGIGLIEYYEQIGSAAAIEEKSRVKKQLTGILVDESGLMITSAGIFRAQLEFTSSSIFNKARLPEDIMVRFPSGEQIPAEFVGKDDDKGIGFIRLNRMPETGSVSFEPDGNLKIGSTILLLQHLDDEYNYELLVSQRTVNAVVDVPIRRYLCEGQPGTLSGFGLVIDREGRGQGVLLTPDNGGFHGGRFDFQSRQGLSLVEILPFGSFSGLITDPPVFREKETSRKKWLGINMQPFTREMAEYYGVPALKGVLVNTILEASPAARSDLRVGDIITAINGEEISAEKDNDLQVFRNLIREQEDDAVEFALFRDDRHQKLSIELSDIPIGQYLADEVTISSLGFSVKELTKDIILAQQLDFDTQGVWVSRVENAGWSDIAGLSVGDLILEADQKPVSGLSDIESYFNDIGQTKPEYVSLFIKRRAETRFLFIKTNYEE